MRGWVGRERGSCSLREDVVMRKRWTPFYRRCEVKTVWTVAPSSARAPSCPRRPPLYLSKLKISRGEFGWSRLTCFFERGRVSGSIGWNGEEVLYGKRKTGQVGGLCECECGCVCVWMWYVVVQ